MISFLVLFLMTALAADLAVGPGKTFTTIQAAVDMAAAGDRVIVDNGNYNETVISKRDGAQGQQIVIESMSYLGAVIEGQGVLGFTVTHDFVVLRGFKFSSMSVPNGAGAVHINGASNVTIEWCAFESNAPRGADSSVLRIENADSVAIRANVFKSNTFGASANDAGNTLHMLGGSFQQVVGNQFDDAEVDVARSHDVRADDVSDATFRHNAVARLGFPGVAGARFAECLRLRIVDNYFGARVDVADVAGANGDEAHQFLDNTVSMNDQRSHGPNIALQTAGSRTLSNLRLVNNLFVLCGEEQWLCGDASCQGNGGGVTMSRITDNVWSGEPDCLNATVTTTGGNTMTMNEIESESQALSLDALSGCNRLSGARGAQTDVTRLPFVSCQNAANILFPYPYPTEPPTPAPTPSLMTPAPTPVAMTTAIVQETAPPTPPPTPEPLIAPSGSASTTSAAPNSAPSAGNTTAVAPVDSSSDGGVSVYVILIIIGPLLLCSVIIGVMTCVAFGVRHKKLKELHDTGGTRMDEVW